MNTVIYRYEGCYSHLVTGEAASSLSDTPPRWHRSDSPSAGSSHAARRTTYPSCLVVHPLPLPSRRPCCIGCCTRQTCRSWHFRETPQLQKSRVEERGERQQPKAKARPFVKIAYWALFASLRQAPMRSLGSAGTARRPRTDSSFRQAAQMCALTELPSAECVPLSLVGKGNESSSGATTAHRDSNTPTSSLEKHYTTQENTAHTSAPVSSPPPQTNSSLLSCCTSRPGDCGEG